jgi:transposase
MDPARFVFLDETGASTNMVRRYGWGPKSERLIDAAPHGHWRTTTFVAGLRSTGFVAPLVLDGPMTGEIFRNDVEQGLAPALKPGDVVVMDNLAAHKVPGVREAMRAAGASLLHLPPCSPDLNPFEQASAKLKAGLRNAGARTRNAPWHTIGRLLDTFSPDECRNDLADSEYELEQHGNALKARPDHPVGAGQMSPVTRASVAAKRVIRRSCRARAAHRARRGAVRACSEDPLDQPRHRAADQRGVVQGVGACRGGAPCAPASLPGPPRRTGRSNGGGTPRAAAARTRGLTWLASRPGPQCGSAW